MDLQVIKQQLTNLFTPEEKLFLNHVYSMENKSVITDINNWLNTETEFKALLPDSGLENYDIKLSSSCSDFIKALFEKYVDDKTFVICIAEHSTVQNCVSIVSNKLVLQLKDILATDIHDIILQAYKKSNCKKVFVYLSSVLETYHVPEIFGNKLKEILLINNIPHYIVFDDVQSMFLIKRNYILFDTVLFTCHSLIPNFNAGILFSKEKSEFGYINTEILAAYLTRLKLMLNIINDNRFCSFTESLYQYIFEDNMFENEIDSNYSKITEDSILYNLYLRINNEKSHRILSKYKDILDRYSINVEDKGVIMIRTSHFILQDPELVIEGLAKLKEILQKCIKMGNML